MDATRTVNILIFDDVEVLDFAGPFEVFNVAGHVRGEKPFRVYTVAEKPGPVTTRGGLSVNPAYTVENCPPADILVVPGGYGTRREMLNDALTGWIAGAAARAELTASVCTGSILLAKAGLLDGVEATTHHRALDVLAQAGPQTTVIADRRVIDNGRVITSGGISAGIDMSLYVVARLLGADVAAETAHYMEYDWHPERYATGA